MAHRYTSLYPLFNQAWFSGISSFPDLSHFTTSHIYGDVCFFQGRSLFCLGFAAQTGVLCRTSFTRTAYTQLSGTLRLFVISSRQLFVFVLQHFLIYELLFISYLILVFCVVLQLLYHHLSERFQLFTDSRRLDKNYGEALQTGHDACYDDFLVFSLSPSESFFLAFFLDFFLAPQLLKFT